MYKHYIFDLYGTLIDLHTDEERPELWRHLASFYWYNGASYVAGELRTAYLSSVRQTLARIRHTEHPDVDITKVFRALYEAKKVEVDDATVRQTTRLFRGLSLDYIRLYDGVQETLAWIKARGGKIYLLSNGQSEFSLPELKQLGIHDFFDGLHFSADYETCKPDVHFMQQLFKAHNIDAEGSIMIGNDHTTDIEIARRLGMDALYIHTNCSHPLSEVNVDCKYQIWDSQFARMREWFA
jgi:putative hydrolase of the HAD superfamily